MIITIIVLLILAVVAIQAVRGDGILAHAKNARDEYQEAQGNEATTLQEYEDYITEQSENNSTGGGTLPKVADNKGKVLSKEGKTELQDDYGNKVVVPAGFMITTDSQNDVTKGIVIEDVEAGTTDTVGSQFVWIPVGNIKKSDGTTENITLGRYTFDVKYDFDNTEVKTAQSTGTPAIVQPKEGNTYDQIVQLEDKITNNYFGGEVYFTEKPTAFTSSANSNGGYYLGRYEARTNSITARTKSEDPLTPVTCKKTNAVYNYVTRDQALSQSEAMYSGKTFTSDLVNSYAWDTAVVFIQKFGKTKNYSAQASKNSNFSKRGTNNDVECNIYDMASNCFEWTTEECSLAEAGDGYAVRGGLCGGANDFTSYRDFFTENDGDHSAFSFRPLLYL